MIESVRSSGMCLRRAAEHRESCPPVKLCNSGQTRVHLTVLKVKVKAVILFDRDVARRGVHTERCTTGKRARVDDEQPVEYIGNVLTGQYRDPAVVESCNGEACYSGLVRSSYWSEINLRRDENGAGSA